LKSLCAVLACPPEICVFGRDQGLLFRSFLVNSFNGSSYSLWPPPLASVPLLIIDDLGMRKLPVTAVEELLDIVMRRYERTSTLLTSNRPVEDWGKLLGDSAAVTAMLDRLLHHGHVLKCGPRSWRTKIDLPPQEAAG
jgi:DNA replication protein DnaC